MSQYNFSFTTGSLYLNESVEILELYLRLQDWEAVKNSCYSENTIQAKTKSSLLTVTREVISRVKLLTTSEINFFQQATFQEQKYLLWIAICRKYSFIYEFATSVLRERYISLQLTLTFEDFDVFFNGKCDWYPELDELADSTKLKVREVIFRMMKEANLLDTNNMIVRALIDASFQVTLQNQTDLLLFPIFDSEIQAVNQ